jgi:hypothetical protein
MAAKTKSVPVSKRLKNSHQAIVNLLSKGARIAAAKDGEPFRPIMRGEKVVKRAHRKTLDEMRKRGLLTADLTLSAAGKDRVNK